MATHHLRSHDKRITADPNPIVNDMSRMPAATPPAKGMGTETRRGAVRPSPSRYGDGSHHTSISSREIESNITFRRCALRF